MPWQDRLKPCTYISPSGQVFDLQYEDVSRSLRKKTTTFEFVGTRDVYVQDNNIGARTFPLTIYFSGEDHDLDANEFFAALAEVGAGRLQHPIYDLVTVNPIGDITRSDRLKTGANESAFDVTFVETIVDLYPASQTNQEANADDASAQFDNDISEEYASVVTVVTAQEQQSMIGDNQDLLGTYKEQLDSLTDNQAELQRNLNDIFNSTNGGIDLLIGEPLTLAFQSVQMIKSVANSTATISDRLTAYGDLLGDLIDPDKTVKPTFDATGRNRLATQNLYASATLSAMCDAIAGEDFNTRDEALAATVTVVDYFFAYMEWKERNYEAVGAVDTGEGYLQLQAQIGITASLIIDVSLSLRRQRTVILDRDTFMIDFAYQYWGTTDNDAVEDMINLNSLDNSDMWTLKKGKLMKFYEGA